MKTKFILPFIMLNLLSGLGSLAMFWYSSFNPIWIGAFLTTFPLPFLLMVLSQIFSLARTSENLPLIQLISFVGVALSIYSAYESAGALTISEQIAVGISILGALSYQWYIRIFSPYNREKSPSIVKGKPLPELALTQLNGTQTNSSEFLGLKSLLVFFRANWCPFCMNQLKEVLAQSDRLKKSGVQVKFISNQGIDNSVKLADGLNLPPHFEILQDEDLEAAKALGIEDIGGSPVGMPGYPADTVMATVIALDEQGQVLFGDETDNYRLRPHPDTFLNVFE